MCSICAECKGQEHVSVCKCDKLTFQAISFGATAPSSYYREDKHSLTLLIFHTMETNVAMNPPTTLLTTTPEALPFPLGVTVDSCSWLS